LPWRPAQAKGQFQKKYAKKRRFSFNVSFCLGDASPHPHGGVERDHRAADLIV
jgi:hypothetical protein